VKLEETTILKQMCMQKKYIFSRKKKATHPVLLRDIPGFKQCVKDFVLTSVSEKLSIYDNPSTTPS